MVGLARRGRQTETRDRRCLHRRDRRRTGGSFGPFHARGPPFEGAPPMLTIPELEPAAIRAAGDRIDPAFTRSPQYVHEGLSARLGAPVIVKVETVNPIRAFKGRGTWLAVQALAAYGRIGPERAVVVASAGNFGQGVAY